jgi:AcrR family transcriptional regulator
MIKAGRMPTVAEAAEAADVSRATAYRYFPTQAALLFGTYDELMPVLTATSFESQDPFERLDAAMRSSFDAVLEYEPFMRATLRQALEHWAAVRAGEQEDSERLPRGGRRLTIDAALAVLEGRMEARRLTRLKATIAALLGIEGHIVMRDIYGMAPRRAFETMRWAARAALAAALKEEAESGRAGLGRPARRH